MTTPVSDYGSAKSTLLEWWLMIHQVISLSETNLVSLVVKVAVVLLHAAFRPGSYKWGRSSQGLR